MKLKQSIISRRVGDTYMAVDADLTADKFDGIIKNNQTSDYIFTLLRYDTTEEAIVDAMCKKYDAPREIIAEDVARIIATLREHGFLTED